MDASVRGSDRERGMSGAASPHLACRGEIVPGDLISFTEAIVERLGGVHGGTFELVGRRSVRALVLKASTSARGARTLMLEVRDSVGYEPLAAGSKTRRQAAKLDQGEVTREPWHDEAARVQLAAAARAAMPLAARAAEIQRTTSRSNARLLGDATDLHETSEEFEAWRAELIETYKPWSTGSGGGTA